MSSSQSPAEVTGSNSEQQKKQSQSRRGAHSTKAHHGRSPQTLLSGKEENPAQKRTRNIQQRSHERGGDFKLRPQTGRSEHNKGNESKPPQRSSSAQNKSKTSHSRKSDSDNKKSPKTNDQSTKSTSSKDIKRTDRKDSGIGYSPPTAESAANDIVTEDNPLIEEKKMSADTEGKSVAVLEVETKQDNRIKYSRDTLLALSNLPVCQERHPALNEFTCDIVFLKVAPLLKPTTEVEAEVKRKHPTALSLIKEQLPKISLSPQRKSFQSGCGWKDSKHQDSPKTTSQDGNFDFESPYPPSKTSQSKPKVIDHIPLRDQEHSRDKKNWRDKPKEPEWATDNNHTSSWDDEPEWMEFGPNDRFELIELKGLEEHEREREARLGRDEAESKPVSSEEPTPVCNESQPAEEGSGSEETTTTMGGEGPQPDSKEELMLKTAIQLDNEFMLDGFDFSTGLSFCQALDEEDEGKSAQTSGAASNAIMKVLQAGGKAYKTLENSTEESILGVSSRPVNALTLDEIQARENIPATPTKPTSHPNTGGDLGAFNKLVAGLQSTGALGQDKNQPEPTEIKATPTTTTSSQVPKVTKPVSILRNEPKHPPAQTVLGTMLEREGDFEEEVVTGAQSRYPTPAPPQFPSRNTSAFSRVEHLERMLEKLDHNHQSMLRQKTVPDVPPPQGFSEPPHVKKMPGHGVRMSTMERPMPHVMEREYIYPESDYRMEMMPPPNIGIRPQGGVTRSSSNNWAVEMERRRLYELKQMERARMMERERMFNGGIPGGMQHKIPAPKPNISLLPTAVMRQLHNSKPNQSLSDVHVSKTNSGGMVPRMDQEMVGKMPPPGVMSDGEAHRMHHGMYPMGGAARPPLRPVSDPSSMMYPRGYYNVIPPHGGMQNPYMY